MSPLSCPLTSKCRLPKCFLFLSQSSKPLRIELIVLPAKACLLLHGPTYQHLFTPWLPAELNIIGKLRRLMHTFRLRPRLEVLLDTLSSLKRSVYGLADPVGPRVSAVSQAVRFLLLLITRLSRAPYKAPSPCVKAILKAKHSSACPTKFSANRHHCILKSPHHVSMFCFHTCNGSY